MKNTARYGAIATLYALAFTFALPSIAQSPYGSVIYSSWGKRDVIGRVIQIAPDTRSVNVVAGETVQFIDRKTGANFVHDFSNERRTYDLNALAPPGVLGGQNVKVHVFAASRHGSGILGYLGDPTIYNRVITITPRTRWINVAEPELVKIVDAQTGNSFVWNFDVRWQWGKMDLSDVTPPGLLSREHVIAYLQDKPEHDNRNHRRH